MHSLSVDRVYFYSNEIILNITVSIVMSRLTCAYIYACSLKTCKRVALKMLIRKHQPLLEDHWIFPRVHRLSFFFSTNFLSNETFSGE